MADRYSRQHNLLHPMLAMNQEQIIQKYEGIISALTFQRSQALDALANATADLQIQAAEIESLKQRLSELESPND